MWHLSVTRMFKLLSEVTTFRTHHGENKSRKFVHTFHESYQSTGAHATKSILTHSVMLMRSLGAFYRSYKDARLQVLTRFVRRKGDLC